MKGKNRHWTARSGRDFQYSVLSDFLGQLEDEVARRGWNDAELARRWRRTPGRVSQVLNNPGNLTLRSMIELSRVLGMKLAIVAYDDADSKNERGPIPADVFVRAWEMAGKPTHMWQLEEQTGKKSDAATVGGMAQIFDFTPPTTPTRDAIWHSSGGSVDLKPVATLMPAWNLNDKDSSVPTHSEVFGRLPVHRLRKSTTWGTFRGVTN